MGISVGDLPTSFIRSHSTLLLSLLLFSLSVVHLIWVQASIVLQVLGLKGLSAKIV